MGGEELKIAIKDDKQRSCSVKDSWEAEQLLLDGKEESRDISFYIFKEENDSEACLQADGSDPVAREP